MKGPFRRPVLLFALALSGCGGGGAAIGVGSTHAAAIVPAPLSTPQIASGGPVTYLQNSGPLSSDGTIAQGEHTAIIAVMSAATQTQNAFLPDTLMVSTPATTQSVARAARSVRRANLTRTIAPVEAFPADGARLVQRLTASPPQASSQEVRRTQSAAFNGARIGTQASVWVQQGPISGTRTSVAVPATLVAQSAHGNIWVDSSLASALASHAAAIAADFENAYASDVAHFASPDYGTDAPGLAPQYSACASDGSAGGSTPAYIDEPGDRRINVMVVNPQTMGGLGGYFSGANYMTQSALNCLHGNYESNQAPFIFVGWFGGNGTAYELQEDLVRSTAHELQHLINFVNHSILATGAATASFNGTESTFVNEGLSMLAQDLAVNNMYGAQGVQFDADDALARANVFLADPGNYSLSGFIGIDPPGWGSGAPQYNCYGGCYGAAYLFERYLRDRFGGDAYTHAIETSGVVGGANLQAVTRESAGDLQDDFALAMAAGTMGVTSSDPRFNFGSLSLTGAFHDQFGGTTQLAGVYATPSSGAGTPVEAPLGGFAYVSVPSVPASGMAVQVTDEASVGGFALTGGLAQH